MSLRESPVAGRPFYTPREGAPVHAPAIRIPRGDALRAIEVVDAGV